MRISTFLFLSVDQPHCAPDSSGMSLAGIVPMSSSASLRLMQTVKTHVDAKKSKFAYNVSKGILIYPLCLLNKCDIKS